MSKSGSIVQLDKDVSKYRCKHWRISVSLGKNPSTGKYKRVQRRVTGSYKEAQEALNELLVEVQKNEYVERSGMTFQMFSEAWVERREKSGDFAPMTVKKYHDAVKVLNHVLGHAQIEEINFLMIEDAFSELRNGNSPSGKELSGTYLNTCHSILNQVMKDAVRRMVIKHNPVSDSRKPAVDTPEKRSLTSEDLLDFARSLDYTKKNEVALMLMATMGLRRGEVAGLDYSNIDFANGVLTVAQSFDDGGNVKAPKTKSSIRQLPIPEKTMEALRTLRNNESADYDGALFHDEFGNRTLPHSFSTWWRRNRKRWGMNDLTLHELRHSYATLMARSGAPVKVTSQLLGHSRTSTTLDIYTHADMSDKLLAVSKMGL